MEEATSGEDKRMEAIRSQLAQAPSYRRKVVEKFILAALGVIPWVGGFLSAAASIKTEEGDLKTNNLQTQWLEEHHKKMERLGVTLNEIALRFENLGEQIDERIQSEEYLDLVRRAFRTWDRADTEEKRKYVANLVTNATATKLCSDDVVRLFIDWLDTYHEAHFAVIREIFKNPGCTRYDIWQAVNGQLPREDSAEADLFKLLIRDLSTGGVIRQERETTADGDFLRKQQARRRGPAPSTMESAFEDTKPYVLTELGKQFVHYTMNEVNTPYHLEYIDTFKKTPYVQCFLTLLARRPLPFCMDMLFEINLYKPSCVAGSKPVIHPRMLHEFSFRSL